MRKVAIIALAAAPFIAVGAGIVAAKLAPALLHRADAQAHTTKVSDNNGRSGR
jgi:hypothetical protein